MPIPLKRKILIMVSTVPALFLGLTLGTGGSRADAAVPTVLPLTIANKSVKSAQVYIYDIGTLLSTGQQGWADAGGTFHPWPAGANPPSAAPDASIVGPANGKTKVIKIPQFSGRIYFSYGKKLVFKLATGGLVQPAVQNASDPNHNILFNWSEYTLNSSGLWLNSTQVDMFSAPYAVGVKLPNGTIKNTGHLKSGGYAGFFTSLKAQSGWAKLVQTRSDGTILRALAPNRGIENGLLSSTAMSNYVNRVWTKYGTSKLTVTPFADQPNTKYYGRVSGNVMNFTNSSGTVVTSFKKPDAASIFGCSNLLDAPNDQVRGPISRTLCAAYNRSTLLTDATQPDTKSADFYKDAVTNQYARRVHAEMVDGKAYAFAFDDVGNFESLVNDGNPQGAYLTLDPFS